MFGHHYPPGISATGHFRPSVSLFASCFFTMTGFHGAHVTGGVVMLLVHLDPVACSRPYSARPLRPVELAGLYWHFVDLVWIILFTIVYLFEARQRLLVRSTTRPEAAAPGGSC